MSGPAQKQRSARPIAFWLLLAAMLAGAAAVVLPAFFRRHSAAQAAKLSPETARQLESLYATYGKSPSCKSCHEEAFALWQNSHHARAERLIDPALDGPAFQSHFTIRHGSQVSCARTRDGRFELVTMGPDGKAQAFTPDRALGVSPLWQYIIPFERGRYQLTELAYDPRHPDWFNVYGEEDRKAGEWGHWTGRGMTWNMMCAGCHNTRVRKNYQPATDSYATTMAERGVGCEACHGPMADHNAWQAAHPKQPGDPTIRKIARQEMFEVCASCHSRRAELTGDFHPGQKFFDHHSLSIPDETDLFYPDGQIRDEDFEVTAFLGSRMHASGVRCIDCHEPHGGKVRLVGNNLCMVCHSGPAPPAPRIDMATHSFHKQGTRGDFCVDCHMPQTVYMQRHARRDHGFTVPDPLLTKELGIPNACNRCHSERDADWAIAYVDKWYGKKMERLSRERTRIIARARQDHPASGTDLTRLLRTDTNALWRAAAAGLLRRWATEPNAAFALLEATRDPEPLVRSMSLRALEPLAQQGHADAVAALRAKLPDPIRSVRMDAAWGLRKSLDTNSPAGTELLAYLDYIGDQPGGLMQRGIFDLDRGNSAAALASLRKALLWDTNSPTIYHGLAVAYIAEGQAAAAVQSLEAACRLAPDNPEFQFKLGLALNEAGRLHDACAALERAVQIDPNYAAAWYNLGLAYNGLNNTQHAIESLLRAETADPRAAHFPYARATILARLGRVSEARAAANRALELQPGYPDALALLEHLSGAR